MGVFLYTSEIFPRLTCRVRTTPNSGGWGNGFCASLVPDTPCINTAHNGATTGSFVADGFFDISLAAIRNEVAQGRRTLVTIQFGHNDQKIAPPESMGANMTAMIEQIRAIKGEPVLITSLTRRTFFSNGTINDALGPWADGNYFRHVFSLCDR